MKLSRVLPRYLLVSAVLLLLSTTLSAQQRELARWRIGYIVHFDENRFDQWKTLYCAKVCSDNCAECPNIPTKIPLNIGPKPCVYLYGNTQAFKEVQYDPTDFIPLLIRMFRENEIRAYQPDDPRRRLSFHQFEKKMNAFNSPREPIFFDDEEAGEDSSLLTDEAPEEESENLEFLDDEWTWEDDTFEDERESGESEQTADEPEEAPLDTDSTPTAETDVPDEAEKRIVSNLETLQYYFIIDVDRVIHVTQSDYPKYYIQWVKLVAYDDNGLLPSRVVAQFNYEDVEALMNETIWKRTLSTIRNEYISEVLQYTLSLSMSRFTEATTNLNIAGVEFELTDASRNQIRRMVEFREKMWNNY